MQFNYISNLRLFSQFLFILFHKKKKKKRRPKPTGGQACRQADECAGKQAGGRPPKKPQKNQKTKKTKKTKQHHTQTTKKYRLAGGYPGTQTDSQAGRQTGGQAGTQAGRRTAKHADKNSGESGRQAVRTDTQKTQSPVRAHFHHCIPPLNWCHEHNSKQCHLFSHLNKANQKRIKKKKRARQRGSPPHTLLTNALCFHKNISPAHPRGVLSNLIGSHVFVSEF